LGNREGYGKEISIVKAISRDDLTIIYYTSNREDPRFEARIQRTLRHMSRPLPIISVSQKPIDFGKNICVGDVGLTGHNAQRQYLIGAKEAKTKYICNAEADFIYPREYFNFVPKRDDTFYFATPLYVLFAQRGKSNIFGRKPEKSGFSMVVAREFLVEKLEQVFNGKEMWVQADTKNNLRHLYDLGRSEYFSMSTPLVSFKTDNNMHRKTPHSRKSKVNELPSIGTVSSLIRKYLR